MSRPALGLTVKGASRGVLYAVPQKGRGRWTPSRPQGLRGRRLPRRGEVGPDASRRPRRPALARRVRRAAKFRTGPARRGQQGRLGRVAALGKAPGARGAHNSAPHARFQKAWGGAAFGTAGATTLRRGVQTLHPSRRISRRPQTRRGTRRRRSIPARLLGILLL